MDSSQASAAALQLSTFTTVRSIPRLDKYSDFPVTVRVTAPSADTPVRAPVDIVAAVDVSQSSSQCVADDVSQSSMAPPVKYTMLDLERDAMAALIDKLGPEDRLAILLFRDYIQKDDNAKAMATLIPMTSDGKKKVGDLLRARHFAPGGGTVLIKPIIEAEKILRTRGDAGRRAAFITLLSQGEDTQIKMKEKVWSRESEFKDHGGARYPVHTFGFTNVANHDTLSFVAHKTNGKYFAKDIAGKDDLEAFAAEFERRLRDATSRPFSADGVSTRFAAMHPGVSISRVDVVGDMKASISGDARSSYVDVGVIKAGEALEFTVYLDVPEGDADADVTDVLAVEGTYTQGWNGNAIKIDRSVVSVSRTVPPPPVCKTPSCEELLNKIAERLEYWCKVKKDLAAMDEKAEATGAGNKCQCTSTAVLREAALESINRAMHLDIYTIVVQVVKMRPCGDGGSDAPRDTVAVDGSTTGK